MKLQTLKYIHIFLKYSFLVMFHMTNNTSMYDVNWLTNEKCLVDNENLDQIGDDNWIYTEEKQ